MSRRTNRNPLSVNDLVAYYGITSQEEELHIHHRYARQRLFENIVETTVQTVLLFVIISSLIARFEIQQTSMEPTFHEGQRVVVSQVRHMLPKWMDRTVYAADDPNDTIFGLHRGNVVVFHNDPSEQTPPLIKRLVGLPNDKIEIKNGAVFINDTLLDEPYLNGVITPCYSYCSLVLGEDEYFFMGDNRPGSRDSRNFGPVKEDRIIGRVILRYWPLNKFEMYE